MQIICFEDERVPQLYPITISRPAYAIGCASFRLIDWLRSIDGNLCGDVRPHLSEIQKLDYGLSAELDLQDSEGAILVNARLSPTPFLASALNELAAATRSTVVIDTFDDSVLAARIVAADFSKVKPAEATSLAAALVVRAREFDTSPTMMEVFRWPHDVVARHISTMSDAMQYRIKHGGYTEQSDGVFVKPGVSFGQHLSFNTSSGPILFEANATVGPLCCFEGPVYVGEGSRIVEHSAIKDAVALGHTVKIGGEVEASVVEPFTNKQHHGFLGHSYLGSWINIGAGTCNSDLKNTYGEVNVQYGDQKVGSGMQFFGCIVGDYAKTAINTSIFTGKTIGVGSMLYGFVTDNVPSFVNYARVFGQTALLPADVMITTQRRMFDRRGVAQRECDKQLIMDMFELTKAERETANYEIR